MSRGELRERFALRNGQFFGHYRYKNLQWELNGQFFGFGDLRDQDIIRIQEELAPDETFIGWNEHHGTDWQQTEVPMVLITNTNIMFRKELVEEWSNK